ncbi:MAG: NAD(P)(+) transhydrogenase (Re/Si-specific) subunit beta [Desulfosarcina sp.]|nr:NAD(P)(+) transhydrogenase (Re/Si-specific) subunit beta [Desulfosarcina sp.]MBC2766669.1 NAD(P)(+) transhydrogenase (Re/Si-specific) subunit beta [Desulfosarcina sp.]
MTDSNNAITLLIDFSVIAVLIVGIWQFRAPRGARFGNLTAAFALLCAFILVLYRNGVIDAGTVVLSLLVGSIAGYAVARSVSMIQIPAMVAFQHGAGGIAAFLVSLVELMRGAHALDLINEVSGILGLTIGSLTFSGSMIAAAKLANKMRQTPQVLPAHTYIVLGNLGVLLAIGLAALYVPSGAKVYLYVAQIALSALFGIVFSIRIGGADMPVLISFLNATAGIAASFCGMVIENQLLIAFGATVAASGSILTHVMCKSMNRSLLRVFVPHTEKRVNARKKMPDAGSGGPGHAMAADSRQVDTNHRFAKAAGIVADARQVIIVPGYGMALAQAQLAVVSLVKKMVAMGKDVKYAIHPVAGRMPGHMNVLLAEAGVDYDMLVEMDAINPEFQNTDLVLVVGACDVVNPAAIDVPGTPISGMPILLTHEAKNVVCCNFDDKPGYSGVPNPLYEKSNTVRGADVKYAIHPVAGRMPGHMNVMLAEAEVDYDNLLEMDEVNPLFAETDVVMVFGACDVVNPAAIQSEGTPISGMPILMAHEAKKIIACNFDKKPGYSGVPNPLYDNSKTIMMLGDAKKSANDLISSLQSID